MAYPGSDVTSRLQMPSSSTRPDPDAALVPQLGSDLSPATLRRVARLERADSPRTAASSAPADDAVSRQARSLIAGPGSFPQSLPLLSLRATGCVAVAEVHGPSLALELVDQLGLDGYHLFHATRADLLRRLGRRGDAIAAYDAAIARTANRAERSFIQHRRDSL